MPTRARPPSVSRKQTIRFGKRSSRRVCNNGNSSGGVNVVKDALPTACDSQGHAKWRTRPYGPLPRLHQTTSFSLRNLRSSRRGRFIAWLFADKSESPPVIHSNDRHDVTLETNHLGLVTTKRSVVRWKNKQKGRIWIVQPSRCLWWPSMRDSYQRFQRSMLSHHYHGELRFILDVVINHRINPFLTTKTSREKQKTPPKCLLRFNTWTQ